MKRLAAAVLAAFVLFGPGLVLSSQAQTRWTQDQLREMAHKVKFQLNAYQKYEQSERDAAQEGMTEQAARFRSAKNKALEAYNRLNAEYQNALAERREYDRKAQMANDR